MVNKYFISTTEKMWKLGNLKRKRLETLIVLLERKMTHFLRTSPTKKIAVIVKYGDGTTNETLNTRDVNSAMYATMCFLEDFLSKYSFRELSKKYATR